MASQGEIYKCDSCGSLIEVLGGGAGTLVCCGEPMRHVKENTVDASKEKHVPVLEKTATGTRVKIGSVPHPMEKDHYIEWVEVINGEWVNFKSLKPGDKPEAEFFVPMSPKLVVREYCNKHGLWRA